MMTTLSQLIDGVIVECEHVGVARLRRHCTRLALAAQVMVDATQLFTEHPDVRKAMQDARDILESADLEAV